MIEVSVPATSANLGAGFDSLGLALNLYNKTFMQEYDGIDIASVDGSPVPTGANNLIYQSVKHIYDACGKPFPGLRLRQQDAIPMARGLGSSSACIAAGLVGGNRLLGNPLSQQELVDMAAVLEGHPDNSTPALLGGFVASVFDGKHVTSVRAECPNKIHFAAFIPPFKLKTSDARNALPKEIAHKDAVFNLSRTSLTTAAFLTGQFELLKISMQDKLHQPYRLSLIPGAEQVFALSESLGAITTYLSGAGSTIMSIVQEDANTFEQNARLEMKNRGIADWKLLMLSADNSGTTVH